MSVFQGCEKDDICTPDAAVTPRLIIVFRDALNISESKEITAFQVIDRATGNPAPLNDEGALSASATDSIAIPLNGATNLTELAFVTGSEDDPEQNVDELDISYDTSDEYVNRACGFRKIFSNLEIDRSAEPPQQRWIERISIETRTIDNTNEIHVQIFH
jgi:hypothetical protein